MAGLEVENSFFFNGLLLPVAIVLRALKKATLCDTPGDTMPARWLNKVLYMVFSSEKYLVGRFQLPVGLSVCAILRKKRVG